MKRNSFLTFMFSFVPGCGLMYLGYMKKGLQVMVMFAAAGFIGAFFSSYSIGWIGGFFLVLLPIVWFYQMFDAMHTVARMKDQGIELPGDDGFYLPEKVLQFSPAQNRTVAKIVAITLILFGSFSFVLGLINNLWRFSWIDQEILEAISSAIRYNLIPAIVSLALIIAGIKLLRGSKVKTTGEISAQNKDGDQP